MTKKEVTIRIIMSKYMMLLICVIVFVNGYSQETVSTTHWINEWWKFSGPAVVAGGISGGCYSSIQKTIEQWIR
jgi:hypothetical protein